MFEPDYYFYDERNGIPPEPDLYFYDERNAAWTQRARPRPGRARRAPAGWGRSRVDDRSSVPPPQQAAEDAYTGYPSPPPGYPPPGPMYPPYGYGDPYGFASYGDPYGGVYAMPPMPPVQSPFDPFGGSWPGAQYMMY